MSIAFPSKILKKGHVHPAVIEAARAVQEAGWRVTSIYRPTGTHKDGVSFDTAPMIFMMGGFGLKTAQLVWDVVHDAVPSKHWLANAEMDHIHVMLFERDTLAMNTSGGTVLYPLLHEPPPATVTVRRGKR